MIDINKKMMSVRDEADACYQASSNLKKDAARLYGAADKLWAAKKTAEAIQSAFLEIGLPFEPDIVSQTIEVALDDLIESGCLGA